MDRELEEKLDAIKSEASTKGHIIILIALWIILNTTCQQQDKLENIERKIDKIERQILLQPKN